MADRIPLAFGKSTSGAATSIDEMPAGDKIPAAYLSAQPPNLYGTYAARPAANTLPAGTLYSASNTKEIYQSNGTAWARVGINSARIASAERTTPYSINTDSFVVLPGMSLQVPACEVPAGVQFGGTMRTQAANTTGVMAAFCDGVQIGQILVGITGFTSYAGYASLPAKTPGTDVTIELRVRQSSAGTAFDIFGDPADKPYIRVVSN
ncbi:hypothetical protein ACQR5V_21325 [Xanthomonas oryzae pv. oryzicola]|uniref:hypothetical protein n=2 Tax=Xanthomonas oryzae TaxID=347 RepID=UPI0005CF6D15|nr:hypothetical protein [Xanthomonas oryzae]AVU02517.1 hypothetical protein C0L90_08655 [Xanthomonas oryzae pv. oryzae]OWB26874.1 hypothetical protein XocBAI21_17600 [Xanthomonas oryzae pv. oryzicola]QBI15719.1 hypothetical protein EYR03_08735 [Xanthomonas oryzae pv. oryzae]QBI15761.1 hypothetical protein EYR03_09015 [Xanthomonas oryzae pv. oryzae]QBN39007.1 hypothetical protein EBA04_08705 [Xanthomonas oryzae pv. oryzae]